MRASTQSVAAFLGGLALSLAFALPHAAAAPAVDTNILANPSFESTGGWHVQTGDLRRGNWAPGPQHGSWFYVPGLGNPQQQIYQEFDLAALGYDPVRLATGGYWAEFSGYHASWVEVFPSVYDEGRISLSEYTASGVANGATVLPWTWSNGWYKRVGTARLAENTTKLRYIFDARRRDLWGGGNDGYLDNASLMLKEYNIWTWGSNTQNYAGAGLWSVGDVTFEGGAAVTNGAEILIGHVSLAGTFHIANGDMRVFGNIQIGTSGNGRVNATGDSLWRVYGETSVGHTAGGEVNVGPGAHWETWRLASIASDPTCPSGVVNVSGGTWRAVEDVFVGEKGDNATVNVEAGGTWRTDRSVYVGKPYDPMEPWFESGSGVVNISGGKWTAYETVLVGSAGPGTVNLNTGAQWTTSGTVVVGDQRESTGVVTVSGGIWAADGPVVIGRIGTGQLTIKGGSVRVSRGHLTVGESGTLLMDGGTLRATGAGTLNVLSAIQFGEGRGTIELNDGYLFHAVEALGLNGGQIIGSGEVHVGAAGINLGSPERKGTLAGTSASEHLTVYGDVSGSGTMTNVTVFGYVGVGGAPIPVASQDISSVPSATRQIPIAYAHSVPSSVLTVGAPGRLVVSRDVTVGPNDVICVDGGLSARRVAIMGGTLTNSIGRIGPMAIDGEVALTDGATFEIEAVGVGLDSLDTTGPVALDDEATLTILIRGGGHEFVSGQYTLIRSGAGLSGGRFAHVTDLGAYVSINGNGLTYDEAGGAVTLTLEMNLNPADGNLDGATDVSDRIIWNTNNFTEGTTFQTGDYNGDGATDVSDRIIWNSNNFTEATVTPGAIDATTTPIPEPATLTLLALGGLAMIRRRRK